MDTSATAAVTDATPDAPGGERNRILRALPPAEHARLRPLLERVELRALEPLGEAGAPPPYAYFPETAVISVVRRMRDGAIIEAGTVGREGMAGVVVLLGDPLLPATLLGQVPGTSLRAPVDALAAALPELPTLQELLRLYALTLLDLVGQTAACNSLHRVEQRCARWLLMTHDQVGSDAYVLTHEVLAQMLAVRRPGVSEVAADLQRRGLIRYHRGRVQVLDRAGLEAVACECYDVVRTYYHRMLGHRAPAGD